MGWYFEQFDNHWVRCYNSLCRAEFTKERASKKRKCPICGIDNLRQIKGMKWIEKQKARRCRSILNDILARMNNVNDGPDGVNTLTFTGSDIRDIEEVVG